MAPAKKRQNPIGRRQQESARNRVTPTEIKEVRKAYAKPVLRTIHAADLSQRERNGFLSIKYLYTNDVYAKARESFIELAYDGAKLCKYRLIFDTLPRTYEQLDVVIVGGNDVARLGSFIRINQPLLLSTPKLVVGNAISPAGRAELLRLGYDDVINMKITGPDELHHRTFAILKRYLTTKDNIEKKEFVQKSLGEICELTKLSPSEQAVLEYLFHKKGSLCRYKELKEVISADHIDISFSHIRVTIYGIRKALNKEHRIETVRENGYKLVLKS